MSELTLGAARLWVVEGVRGGWPVQPPDTLPILTRLAFMDRFTTAELVAIYTEAKTSVETEIWLDKTRAADHIDLTDARTREAVAMLEAGGLIAEGRADAILTP